MIRGIKNTVGISINISNPLWFSDNTYIFSVNERLQSYSHTISAEKGFDSANITFLVDEVNIDDWLDNGLGRHVVVYGSSAEVIWEGFVSKVTIAIGSLSASRGPLFDIANRVTVVYTPIIDSETDPPVTAAQTETPIAEDTDSQDKYGIIEKIISGGQLLDDGSTDEAEEARDLYLAEMKDPYTDETVNISTSNVPNVTLECLGYKEWLKAYAYNADPASTVTLTTKLIAVLDADPNSIFSSNQVYIDTNAQLTNTFEDQNRFADTIISEILSLGDGSDNRWLFNVYEDRIPRYYAIPTSIEYLHMLTANRQQVTTLSGGAVNPWAVRAGKWFEITDFMSGIERPSLSLRTNPRALFAESVTYTMPFGLTITGSRVSKLSQRLAQLGIGGT